MNDTFEQIFDFYKRYLTLENTINTFWDKYNVSVDRKESFADNTLELIFIATLFHKKLAYPISEKLIDMLLVSSVDEIIVGNTVSLIGEGDAEINSASQNSVKQIFEVLGEGGDYYYLLWEDYNKGESATSRYTKQIKAFNTLLKSKYYEDDTDLENIYDVIYNEYRDTELFKSGILKNFFQSVKPLDPDVVWSVPDFAKEHPHAIIANYDAQYAWGYGFSYNTSTGEFIKFPKYAGEYITYPAIEQYQVNDPSVEEVFILYRNTMYELEKVKPDYEKSNYKIKREIKTIKNFFKDYGFEHSPNIKQAYCTIEEILKIVKQ